MKLLKNRGVAIVLAILMIAGSIFLGWQKAPAELVSLRGGSWVADTANVLSPELETYINQENGKLIERVGAKFAIATVDNAKGWDLSDYAYELAESWSLSGVDMILVLDIDGDNYWMIQGYDLVGSFTDDMVSSYVNRYLEPGFAARDYELGVKTLFDQVRGWYNGQISSSNGYYDPLEEGVLGFHGYEPYVSTISSVAGTMITLGTVIPVIVFVIVIIAIASGIDSVRYSNYRRRYRGMASPPVVFRPLVLASARQPLVYPAERPACQFPVPSPKPE